MALALVSMHFARYSSTCSRCTFVFYSQQHLNAQRGMSETKMAIIFMIVSIILVLGDAGVLKTFGERKPFISKRDIAL